MINFSIVNSFDFAQDNVLRRIAKPFNCKSRFSSGQCNNKRSGTIK